MCRDNHDRGGSASFLRAEGCFKHAQQQLILPRLLLSRVVMHKTADRLGSERGSWLGKTAELKLHVHIHAEVPPGTCSKSC